MASSVRRETVQTDWSDRIMTVEEFQYANPLPEARTELVDGRMIVREPPRFEHGHAAFLLAYFVQNYVNAHSAPRRPLGHLATHDPGMLLSRTPGTVRAPDIAYYMASRIPNDWTQWFDVPPDMITEVRSPSDRPGYLRRKLEDWQRWGCKNVWVLDPGKRTFTVMHGDDTTTLQVGDVFEGGPLFPGLALPVASVFR